MVNRHLADVLVNTTVDWSISFPYCVDQISVGQIVLGPKYGARFGLTSFIQKNILPTGIWQTIVSWYFCGPVI
jgi:hypothetical protein